MQGGCVSALQEKLKYTKDGFCCLVVTSASEPDTVRGAVEISLQGEKVRPNGSLAAALASRGQPCASLLMQSTMPWDECFIRGMVMAGFAAHLEATA